MSLHGATTRYQTRRSSSLSTTRRTSIARSTRSPAPKKSDAFSLLPFELFSEIVGYTFDTSSETPQRDLKALSTVNKTIRAKCVAVGLFEQLNIDLQHPGGDSMAEVCSFVIKTNAGLHIQSLSLHNTVIGDSPCALPFGLSRLLQHLPELRKLTFKGLPSLWKPSPHEIVVKVGGMLQRTLSSGQYLQKLQSVEIVDLTISYYVADIVAAIRGLRELTLNNVRITSREVSARMISTGIRHMHYHTKSQHRWSSQKEVRELSEESLWNFLWRGKIVLKNITCFSFKIETFFDQPWAEKGGFPLFCLCLPNIKTFVASGRVPLREPYQYYSTWSRPPLKQANLVCRLSHFDGTTYDYAYVYSPFACSNYKLKLMLSAFAPTNIILVFPAGTNLWIFPTGINSLSWQLRDVEAGCMSILAKLGIDVQFASGVLKSLVFYTEVEKLPVLRKFFRHSHTARPKTITIHNDDQGLDAIELAEQSGWEYWRNIS
jgi:hypothetical protein